MSGEALDVRSEQTYRATRRAYERARWTMSLLHAVAVCGGAAAIASLAIGMKSLVWLPLTFVVWALVTWRGSALLRGGRLGALAGLVTLVLPMAWLQACCTPGTDMLFGCCSMPFACMGVGGALGLLLALFLPHGEGSRRLESAVGMLLGLVGVATLRCSGLFLGEAAGLLGGLAGGVIVTATARAVLDRHRAGSPAR